MTPGEKNVLLDKLSVAYHRINYLELLCKEQGNAQEAVQLAGAKTALRRTLDRLLDELYTEWAGQAAKLSAALDASNANLQEAIERIERNIATGKTIVKALRYADDVIKLAAALMM